MREPLGSRVGANGDRDPGGVQWQPAHGGQYERDRRKREGGNPAKSFSGSARPDASIERGADPGEPGQESMKHGNNLLDAAPGSGAGSRPRGQAVAWQRVDAIVPGRGHSTPHLRPTSRTVVWSK